LLGITAEAHEAHDWKSAFSLIHMQSVWPEFQVQGVALHQAFFLSEN